MTPTIRLDWIVKNENTLSERPRALPNTDVSPLVTPIWMISPAKTASAVAANQGRAHLGSI